MSLLRKMLLGFGALWLILLAVCVISVWVFTSYRLSLQQMLHENYDSVVFCDQMKQSIDALNTWAQETASGKKAEPAPTAAAQTFDLGLASELGNCTLPGEDQLSRHVEELWRDYKRALEQFKTATGAARETVYKNQMVGAYKEIHSTVQAISDMNLARMKVVDVASRQTLGDFRLALLVFLVAGFTVAIVSAGVLAHAVLQPLVALTESAKQIAGGNLDLTVQVRSRDQIGQLAEAFNTMAGSLRKYRAMDHARLQRTQQTTQLAIDSLPDGVVVMGVDGTIEISNLSARQHFALEPGKKVADLGLPWLQKIFERTRETGLPVDPRGYDSALQLFDQGEERFLLPHAVPMFSGDHHVIGVAVILVDVTRLRRADEMKSGLVSTVSHELKTPLTSTRMAVHLLAEQIIGPLNERQKTVVQAAKEDTDRLHRTIDNLLSMSRIESGKAALKLTPTSVGALLSQALDPLRDSFAKKQIALHGPERGAELSVWVDRSYAVHIFSNLLSNAMKFTPSGGEVTLSAESVAGGVRIAVRDTGVGISAEHVGQLFKRFFRVPTPEGPSGAGLGLSIAREIAEAHGGSIGVESTVGAGSTFFVVLPAQAAEAPAL